MKTLMMILFALTILTAQEEKNYQIKMPAIFSDDMVLQQKTDAAIWGKAAPDSKIKVTASWGKSAEAVTDINGNWIAKIKTPEYGGPYELQIEDENSRLIFKNINQLCFFRISVVVF